MTAGSRGAVLDLYVAAPDFAVAAGVGIVLLWDGGRWSPIVEDEELTLHRRAWASGERDVVFYDARREGADLVCPHLPGAVVQPFCRRFGSRMVGACGQGNRIHIVLANGDIHRVNNMALDAEGTFRPVFDSAVTLQLTDAWFPAASCAGGQSPPEAAASDVAGATWQFDGRRWRASAGES